MNRLLFIVLAVSSLTACGTCIGASCPEPEPAQTGSFVGYIEEDAGDVGVSAEISASTVEMLYTDADGNTWQVTWDSAPVDNGE